jgi:hypothetical protein
MAEQVTLNVNVETGEAVKNLGDLEKATKGVAKSTEQAAKSADSLEDRFDQLNKEIKEGPVNIRKMNKQIQEYQAIALEAGRTSPLGKQAIAEAAALKDRYNDITAEVNRLANDGVKLQAALDLGTSITAGYTAFQGALALSGVESEKLQETLIKLQAAQSLLVGVETIRKNLEKESTLVLMAKNVQEKLATAGTYAYAAAQGVLNFVIGAGSKALKLFRLALISTGIGAIIVGIGALIANFGKVKEVVMDVIDTAFAPFKAALQFLGILESDEEKAREERQKALKKRLEEEKKLRANRVLQIENNLKREQAVHNRRMAMLDNAIALEKSLGKNTVDLERAKLMLTIKLHQEQKPLLEEQIALKRKDLELEIARHEQIQEQAKILGLEQANNKKLLELRGQLAELKKEELAIDQQIEDSAVELVVFENNIATEKRKERKKAAEEKKKQREKEAEEKKKQDEKDLEDARKKAAELEKIERQRIQNIQKLEDELFATIEQLDEEARQRNLTDQQKEIEAVNEKYFALINDTRLGEEEILRLKTQLKEEEAAINEKFRLEQEAADKESREKQLQDEQELKDKKIQLALDGIDAIMNLTNAFAKDNEKSQRRAFEINKKLQIAQALIQTYQGVNAIFASAAANPASIPFPAYPYIQAGIALASGLANVQNIRKQQFQGGSESGGVTTPNFNTGGGGGAAPQIAPVTNTSTLLGQEPQQVFVTETDITNTQNQVAVIETQATIK